MIIRFVCLLPAVLLTAFAQAGENSAVAAEATARLKQFAAHAIAHYPQLQAAREQWLAAEAQQRQQRGFYDPVLTLASGLSRDDWSTATLGTPRLRVYSTTAEAHLSLPLPPGAYLNLGAVHAADNAFNRDHFEQTLVTAQLSLPLLRDRGFRQQHLRHQSAKAVEQLAYNQLQSQLQHLHLQLLHAYVTIEEHNGLLRAAGDAGQRASILAAEAEQLVDLQVIPAYQLLYARLDLTLRQEEILAAQAALETAWLGLENLTGPLPRPLPLPVADFIAWAAALPTQPFQAPQYVRLGSWQVLEFQRQETAAALAIAEDNCKADLALNLGSTWRDNAGAAAAGSDAKIASSLMLVYRRPLGNNTAQQELMRRRALLAAANAELDAEQQRLRTNAAQAYRRLIAAQQRLELGHEAVANARAAMDAEAERFRLGESRSRDVLDAQKDLTTAERLQTRIAAELLRAYADYRHAGGFLYLLEESSYETVQ